MALPGEGVAGDAFPDQIADLLAEPDRFLEEHDRRREVAGGDHGPGAGHDEVDAVVADGREPEGVETGQG